MRDVSERIAAVEERLQDLAEIRRDVKKLLQFRGWILGAATAAGAIGGVVLDFFRR